MANINITRQHHLDDTSIRHEVQGLADKLAEDLAANYSWEDDRLVFKRTGASGYVRLGDKEIEVNIKLNMLLAPLKGTIEERVASYLDERLS